MALLLLPQTLTVREARDALRMLAQALRHDRDGPVVMDGSALEHFDSSALAVLIECHRLAEIDGRGYGVQGLPPKLHALAKLYGVDTLLPAAEAVQST